MVKPEEKRLLLLLGGEWHDFDGFARTLRPVLTAAGYRVEVSRDLERLTRLGEEGWDALLTYTCFTAEQDPNAPPGLSRQQAIALRDWVQAGGAFLALHAASVIGTSGPEYRALLGGEFCSHPPPFTFTIYPLSSSHPILSGLPALTVHDEFYLQVCDSDVTVLMVAALQEKAYPMLWSKMEGRGRVAYFAPGHFREVWENSLYQWVILQILTWLTGG